MDYYATLKTGLRLYASTRINPILLTRSPETALYSPGRKDLVQEIKSYKIVGREGGGNIKRWGCSSDTSRQQEAAMATADTTAA